MKTKQKKESKETE